MRYAFDASVRRCVRPAGTNVCVRDCGVQSVERRLRQQLRVTEDGRSLRVQTDLPHLVSLGAGRLSTTVTLLPIPPGICMPASCVPCSVLFFRRPRSESWPHHGRTFSIFFVLCHSD